MRPEPALALLIGSVGLAGCLGGGPLEGLDDDAAAPLGLAADCGLPEVALRPDGECALIFDPADGRDREASLAAHPSDPNMVAITWRVGEFSEGPDIYAAVTTDGGATWNVQELTDPSLNPVGLPERSRYSYDSTAGVGPDGSAYVLYGGENPRYIAGASILDRMTLAKSTDGGATWSYRPVTETPSGCVAVVDYMDLAVAPDTGHLYAVANRFACVPLWYVPGTCAVIECFPSEGNWVWKSTDGGATWSPPTILHPTVPVADTVHYLPRIVAGPDGLVAVTTNHYDANTGRLRAYATISRDGGERFDAPMALYDAAQSGTFIHDPAAVGKSDDGELHIGVVFNGGDKIEARRSSDAGRTWSDPVTLHELASDSEVVWLSAAAHPDGTLWAQYRHGGEARFGVGVVRWGTDGSIDHLDLVDASGVDGQWVVGDDYGAFDVAPDGTAWAAWSDLRGGDGEWVSVAHVLPPA